MAGRELVTERDVRAMAPGATLVLGAGRIATPGALDAAFARGVRVRYADEGGPGPAAGSAAPAGAGLVDRMRGQDGTYVVVVRGGRLIVSRVTDRGPEPFGEE